MQRGRAVTWYRNSSPAGIVRTGGNTSREHFFLSHHILYSSFGLPLSAVSFLGAGDDILISISGFHMMLYAGVCLTDLHCFPFFFLANPSGKEFTRQAGNMGSIPGPGRSPGEGNGHPL